MSAISQLIATQANRNRTTSPMQAMAQMQQLDAGKQRLAAGEQNMQLGAQRMQMGQQAMQGDQAAMAKTKREEGLKFAANVAAQMRQASSPEEKAKIYQAGLEIAKMNQHDVSAFPQQFDENAERLMEGMYQQVFQPEEMKKQFLANAPKTDLGKLVADRDRIAEAGGDTSMFDEAIKQVRSAPQAQTQIKTTSQRDYDQYQQLKQTDPEAAEEFGRKTGFLSKEGIDLSAHMEKRLSTANDEAVDSAATARRLESLASEFEGAEDLGSGLFGSKWAELLKKTTGEQDAHTALRKKYNGIRASQAVNNLPPGAASDKDIELALSGFPDADANGEHIAQWMRGVIKLEEHRRDFAEHRVAFISKHGHERGLLDEWKAKFHQEKQASTGKYSIGQEIEHDGKRYRVTGGDLNDPDVELIE